MKNDLVSRQKAIDIAYKYRADIIAEEIEDLPSAQSERNRGHWVGIDDEPCETWECDKCGYIQECFEDELPNYCPNCGADNRESDDGQV